MLTASKPARHGLSSRGKGVSDIHSLTKNGRCETVASGSLFGQICRLALSGLGRAVLSRKADPVWLVSAPPRKPSPAGREHPLGFEPKRSVKGSRVS
jgi:hypothetical protein